MQTGFRQRKGCMSCVCCVSRWPLRVVVNACTMHYVCASLQRKEAVKTQDETRMDLFLELIGCGLDLPNSNGFPVGLLENARRLAVPPTGYIYAYSMHFTSTVNTVFNIRCCKIVHHLLRPFQNFNRRTRSARSKEVAMCACVRRATASSPHVFNRVSKNK